MTVQELYEFDLRGYLICHDALTNEQIVRVHELVDSIQGCKGNGKFSFFGLDPIFMEIMANPRTLGYMKAMLGDWFRFDHAFGIQMTNDSGVTENLHAGPMQNQRAFWYQWGPGFIAHNGLVKVIYTLCDVNPGDGGFVCVPGSHKSNLPYKPTHDSHLVINPRLQAGDMLIFTEALVHGSWQWAASRTRRTLNYSYAPGFMAWKSYDTIIPYLQFATTDVQRDLLRAPYVANYDEGDSREGNWRTDRRTPLPIAKA
jgi:hypothetical protein